MRELPSGWAKSTIDDVVESRVGQHGPTVGEQFIYIDIGSVDRGTKRIVTPQTLPMNDAPSRARQNVRSGDVLVSMTRPNLNAVAIVPPELDGAIASTGFEVLRPDHVSPQWLYYLVQTNDFIDAMTSLTQGALYPAVRPKDIRNYEIEVPPLREQQRVAEQIDALSTVLDAGVATLNRLKANLKRYRTSVLKAACEGRLVPTEAELARKEGRSYESAEVLLKQILADRRAKWEEDQLAKMIAADKPPKNDDWKKKYKEPEPPVTSDLPELPEGWTWANIDQLVGLAPNAITDGPFGSNLKTEHYTATGPRVLRLQNIGDASFIDAESHISAARYQSLSRHAVFAGDIVIAAFGNPAPRACIVPDIGPAIVKADCIRFKPSERVLTTYVMYALNSDGVRKRTTERIHGIGRPRINLTEIKEIVLPLPPFAEQQRIAQAIEAQFTDGDNVQAVVETNLARAAFLRQSILKRAFEGELVPQDPKDEPASVLLERIRRFRLTEPRKVRMSPKKTSKKPEPQKSIIDALLSEKRGMSPEQLLNAAGFTSDTIDDFYAELKQAVLDGHVREIRHGHAVTLEAKQL